MSEIPFINALGHALDAVTAEPKVSQDRRRRRVRVPRPRRRLVLVFVALVLAGGAAAHTLLSSSQLAAGNINCSYGTSNDAPGVEGVIQTGVAPIAACLREYRRAGPAALTRPGVRFVACEQDANDVDVFVATGQRGQCRHLGYSPLPGNYTAAAVRIHKLEQALGALQRGHDCLAPAVLVREVHNTLARMGFVGWRPAPYPGSNSGGRCGRFPATDTQPSDPYLALDSSTRTVLIDRGPPLSISRLIDRVEPPLRSQSGARCLTAQTARTITRAAFAPSPLSPRFATSAELRGERFNGRPQERYDHGCTVIVTTAPALDGRHVDVWLNARDARPLRFGQGGPPASAYGP